MSFKIQYHQAKNLVDPNKKESLNNYLKDFWENHPRSEIFNMHDNNAGKRKELISKHSNKKHFFHIGMGGSSLGPEFLVKALHPTNIGPQFIFLNNVDSDEVHASLKTTKLEDSLFYVVSKSGSTIETLSLLAIIDQELTNAFGESYDKSEYFVFCTDPQTSFLKELAIDWNVPCLEIPSNIGGRYSVFTDVGLFPLELIGIDDLDKHRTSYAKELGEHMDDVIDLACQLTNLYENDGINQTVLMPYSSLLKSFSLWFVQLWAESLGKISKNGVPVGLTPIFAYGPTDQHSQVQLFMEGPRNKTMLFLEVAQTKNQYKFNSSIPHEKIKLINGKNLQNVLLAELSGSRDALIEKGVPCFSFQIDSINSENLVKLVLFSELLTIAVGHLLEVDPFDQPGVELGKLLCINYLKS